MSTGCVPGGLFITVSSVEVAKRADQKLILIPLVFILVRVWGTIRFFRFLACLPDCQNTGPSNALPVLVILQVIVTAGPFSLPCEMLYARLSSVRIYSETPLVSLVCGAVRSALVSSATVIWVVTQRFFPTALRDDPNNGCRGDYNRSASARCHTHQTFFLS